MLENPRNPHDPPAGQPLADKIRPRKFEDFIGQSHIRTKLEAMGKADHLSSQLYFGPPGCGKSTLALLMAMESGLPYLRVSAPEAGLAELRKRIKGIRLLILDELHRFSKAQQDFFLPILESGEIILLATTTENPSFSVTRQLLSRLHVHKLRALSRPELQEIATRGAQALRADIPVESLEVLTSVSHGDARTLLNLVEYTSQMPEENRQPDGLHALLPDMVIRGDRDGDSHYELASALIKSIRGSDPDAAVYYLACLMESGEDPRFVTRRLILSAGEDIGLADPQALQMAVACQQAVEFVGMPEGFIPMAETAVYLALAKKSNSTYMAYRHASAEIRKNGTKPVPMHLRNASTKLQKDWGYKQGYQYPHDYQGGWVPQQYLPDEVQGKSFYRPRGEGQEPRLAAWWKSLTRNK
ncbi:replication-associated recombination protein A [Desulfovibrio ferrophilus]|uniref:Replication-associated recombination protein A n=1 Tax=Desulfovibrio ferrophilus TaxID=241368 RepID=A0A2Z6AWL4_9BACT|nr:replication-associated recombination protein A [Desulfovibrio ferrophilus]BBD07639.1 AAA ATPase central domain protein [Desulfovibrio ferrophilus]